MYRNMLLAAMIAGLPLAQAADLPAYPFVHVNGYGTVYTMPDTGEIDFVVSATDGDPERLRATVEQRIGEVNALLAKYGVPAEDAEVHNVQREMKIVKQEAKQEATPDAVAPPLYQLRCNMRVKVRALTAWKDVVSALLAMPNLDDFSTAFDTSERAKVEAELTAQALRNARKKAQDIAAGIGRRLGPASGVSTGELRNLSRAMGMAANDFSPAAGVHTNTDRNNMLAIQSIKLGQPVNVIYSLK